MIGFNKKIDGSKNDSRKWNGRKDTLFMWGVDMDIENLDWRD